MDAIGLATLGFGSVVAGLFAAAAGVWVVSQLAEEHRRRRSRRAKLDLLISRCAHERVGTGRLIHDRRPLAGSHDQRPQRRPGCASRSKPRRPT